ncbi:DEAD/DEAH box helicase family protein [Candidatus Kuenenbacteria bacterium]|nr:DEAD/DEAH box helicase family protein [Candidatus Kuenenbacteria bacterium]
MLEFEFLDSEKLESRYFQLEDAEIMIDRGLKGENCGLVYPTGIGKTIVAFFVMDHYLRSGKKVLFLAHTTALINQHMESARSLFKLPDEKINKITGRISEKKRVKLWGESRIIFATPQTIDNEIKKGTIDFDNVGFVVFDEMHMADKKYAYVALAKLAKEKDIRTIGLTASSGRAKRIEVLEDNYNIKWWVYRSAEELKKFVFPKQHLPIIIDYPRLHRHAMKFLRSKIVLIHNELASTGLIDRIEATEDTDRRFPFYRLTELNKLYPPLKRWLDNQKKEKPYFTDPINGKRSSWQHFMVMYIAYYKLMHLLHVFVTEGYEVSLEYVEKIRCELVNKGTPERPHYRYNAAFVILFDYNTERFIKGLHYFIDNEIAHPKIARILELIEEYKDRNYRMLVFSNFESTVKALKEYLTKMGYTVETIAGSKFMKPKEQQAVLARFKEREFQILLSTTVVEAGIDVPKIDVVINYSMPLTGIARIQRGGRAGRTAVGLVYYLIMENSNDSSLYYAARSDNVAMVKELKKRLTIQALREQGHFYPIRVVQHTLLFASGFEEREELTTRQRESKGRRAPSKKKIVNPKLL